MEACRQTYADPSHRVHKLVPDEVLDVLTQIDARHGNPERNEDTVWDVYLTILGEFRQFLDNLNNLDADRAAAAVSLRQVLLNCQNEGFRDNVQLPEDGFALPPNAAPADLGNVNAVVGNHFEAIVLFEDDRDPQLNPAGPNDNGSQEFAIMLTDDEDNADAEDQDGDGDYIA